MANILEAVQHGMRVYDSSGEEIGTVDYVQFGDEDPSTEKVESATVSPAVQRDETILDAVQHMFRVDEIPDALQARLLRFGFVRIDAKGLFAADRYITPDQIASVADDKVALNVGKDALTRRVT
jgi:hypothetical protein